MALFRHHACFDKIDDSLLRKELEDISLEIVKKLKRIPLAIKSVASQLRSIRDVNKVRDILKGSNLIELNLALMWSYQQLDKALQQCFLSCSIFPKGHKFTKDALLSRWLALNYIRSSDYENVEDIGSKYFDKLVSLFFFQPADGIGGEKYFVMHDAFHDFAESLTKGECFRIEDEQAGIIPSTVHHLSIAVGNLKEHVPGICKLERLKTLIFLEPFEEDSRKGFDEILKEIKKLRILSLMLPPSITQLPETVCELKYLKYLNFLRSSITQVPESLSSLHLLYSLELPFGIHSLPKSISNLRNLRFVGVYDKENSHFCRGLPPLCDVGKLTTLQTLLEFHVRKEKGYELQQLGNLRELKGCLYISGLENVSHKDEAAECKIKNKNLDELVYEWSQDLNGRNSDFETIQALQPPNSLNNLTIIGYSADKYPTWLGDESVRHLCMLMLDGCNFLEALPSNLHILKYCKEIKLTKLQNLKELGDLPPCLKKLSIAKCSSLVLISKQECIKSNQEVESNYKLLMEKEFVFSKIGLFLEPFSDWTGGKEYYQEMMCDECDMFQQIGKLTKMNLSKELKILGCVQDKTLPKCEEQLKAWWNCHEERVKFIYTRTRVLQAKQFELPSSLKELDLYRCNITDRALSDCLSNLCSLEHLGLQEIMTLVTLPLEDTMSQLSMLRFLRIESCWLLRSLGALYKLYLDEFEVDGCPSLEIRNEIHGSPLSSSLKKLQLCGCAISTGTLCGEFPKLNDVKLNFCRTSASLSVEKLTSVTSLELYDCPDICSLSGLYLLRNLEKLVLKSLPKLKVKDHLQSWASCTEELHTDNLELLEIFKSKTSVRPKILFLEHLKEETIMLENLLILESLEGLYFFHCKIKSIPTSFTNLSSLQVISFKYCPDILELPEFPNSVTKIIIKGCPVLKKRCRRDGEDWPKISDIKYKDIE